MRLALALRETASPPQLVFSVASREDHSSGDRKILFRRRKFKISPSLAQSFARVQFGSFQNPRRRAVVWKTVVGSKSNLENEAQDTNMASLAPGGYMGLVSE